MGPRKNENVRGQKAMKRPPNTPQQSQEPEDSTVTLEDAEDKPMLASISAECHGPPCIVGSTSSVSTAAASATTDEDETEKGRDIGGEDTQPPAKRRRNDSRPPVVLSEEEVAEMAEFLKENDCLYNRSRDLWRDTQARACLWDRQGQAMNRTGLELQHWYESLRTKLGRLKKKAQKSGSGADVLTDANRRLLQIFYFLTPHMYVVQRKNAVRLQERNEVKGSAPREEGEEGDREEGAERQIDPEDDQEEAASHQQSSYGVSKDSILFPRANSSSRGNTPQRSLRLLETDVLDHLIKNQQNCEHLMAISAQMLRTLDRTQSQHPDREQFTNYVGSVLQQLPEDLYRKANRLLSNLLLDIQDEASVRRQDCQLRRHRDVDCHTFT